MINITHTAQTVSVISGAIATGNLSAILQVIGQYLPAAIIFFTQLYSMYLKALQHKEVLSAVKNTQAPPVPAVNPIVDMVQPENKDVK